MCYFDYVKAAREAGIPDDKLDQLRALVEAEFPGDDMMVELHLLRACKAVRDGRATLQEVLRPDPAAAA